MSDGHVIVGGGISGLVAGHLLDGITLEKELYPGGILASYYRARGQNRHNSRPRMDKEALFEVGGGHWLWGLNPKGPASKLLRDVGELRQYRRRSSVYLVDWGLFIPYPIQYNLRSLPKDLKHKAYEDLIVGRRNNGTGPSESANCSFSKYAHTVFGETLCDLFFDPHNRMYTAGMYEEVLPPRRFKVPDDIESIKAGLDINPGPPAEGYNTVFYYPTTGLGSLMWSLARKSRVLLGSRVTRVDLENKTVFLAGGKQFTYSTLFNCVPLNEFSRLSGFALREYSYTGVLVVNCLAHVGKNTPLDHWTYLSRTRTGFHRIGFYSNVDRSFLPSALRGGDFVSAYIEKAFRGGQKPRDVLREAYLIAGEAVELGFLGEVIDVDPTYVDVAYTWRKPGSGWIDDARRFFESHSVVSIGRYANWGETEGIVESINDAYAKTRNIRFVKKNQ